jgi:hypothetical protein
MCTVNMWNKILTIKIVNYHFAWSKEDPYPHCDTPCHFENLA